MRRTMAALLAALLCAGALPVSAAEAVPGDVNGDGSVDAADAAKILEIAASIGAGENVPEDELNAADLDGDGEVTAMDAALLLRYSADSGSGAVQESFGDYMTARTAAPELLGVQYCYNGYNSFSDGDSATVITSTEELETFLNENSDNRFLNRDYDGYGGHCDDVNTTCERYDSDWFAEHDLILLRINTSEYCNWIKVTDISADAENNWNISVTEFKPAWEMPPMYAGWFAFVETNKGVELASSLRIDGKGEYIWDMDDLPQNSEEQTEAEPTAPELIGVRYCYNGYESFYNGNSATVVTSAEELEAFFDKYRPGAYLDKDYDGDAGHCDSVTTTCERYDNDWFVNHDLVMLCLNGTDYENWFEVTDITADAENNWVFHATEYAPPDVASPLLVGWFAFVETNKSVELASGLRINVTSETYGTYA